MSKETGGPAFPIPGADFQTFQPPTIEEWKRIQSGMTLRDYFAGLALSGMMANSAMLDNVTDSAVEWAAKGAYKLADAMLKARSE